MKRRRTKKFTRLMQVKLLGLFGTVVAILVALNIGVARIGVNSGDTYARQVLSQNSYDSETIPARRGQIQDRNGNVLAYSEKVYNLILDCYQVNSGKDYLEPTVKALCAVYDDLDESRIRSLITSEDTKNSRYQVLLKSLSAEEKEAFEDYTSTAKDGLTKEQREELNNVQGVWFEASYKRQYPLDELASSLVGFSNSLDQGTAGVESYYDDILNGTDGREYGYLDEDSDLERTTVEPTHGNSLTLTIDVNIQEIVERYIAAFDAEHAEGPNSEELNGKGSKNTAVVIMDPNTGEILAMASNHSYDLNNPYDLTGLYTDEEISDMSDEEISAALSEVWSNFCVSEDYEPGSVFKPMTVASALDTGAITADDTFYCDGGEYITDTQINCDNIYGHGMETVGDAIKNSCNDALMQIAAKMGISEFCKYQNLFCFGATTGIDLPNESTGTVYAEKNMHEVELATSSFGQSLTCTMVQEITAFSAVVNGGYYYKPHVVKKITDSDGTVVKTIEPTVLRQVVSSKSSSLLREYLELGVKEGTGQRAQVPGYRVGGKTGTAEKIDKTTGQRASGKYLVSFIGAAPIDDPQIVVYVVVDEPNVDDESSGGYALVLARSIMMEVLPYLNIPATEEITQEVLNVTGLTWEDVENVRVVQTEAETETDTDGNVLEAGSESEAESETESETQAQVADNPNIPAPLSPTDDDAAAFADNSVTAEELLGGVS